MCAFYKILLVYVYVQEVSVGSFFALERLDFVSAGLAESSNGHLSLRSLVVITMIILFHYDNASRITRRLSRSVHTAPRLGGSSALKVEHIIYYHVCSL